MSEHAQFRNYSFSQGRWLAPDPYDGSYDITNPESLNRYAYAGNNPLTFIDPSGLYVLPPDPDPCSDPTSCIDPEPPPVLPCASLGTCGTPHPVGGGPGGGGTGTPPKKPVNENCPAVPQAPPGVNLSNNMNAAANAAFLPDPFGLLWFNNQVQYGEHGTIS
jgi:hypothetical protein